jgi:hypothetical protein
MADDDRLAGKRIASRACEEQHTAGDVVDRLELAVHGVLQHDVFDDLHFRQDAVVL